MAEVALLSGAGRYADPWHDFDATSARLAQIISELGHRVTISTEVEQSLADLTRVGLLIVNLGNPADGRPAPATEDAITGLRRYVGAGGPILAVHSSATTFTTFEDWSSMIGGHWLRGQTMHPPYGPALIHVREGSHRVIEGLRDFQLTDERYSYLVVEDDAVVVCDHEHGGASQPLIWAVERGRTRAVYDGLGHSVESYDSPEHRALLTGAVSWLLETAG